MVTAGGCRKILDFIKEENRIISELARDNEQVVAAASKGDIEGKGGEVAAARIQEARRLVCRLLSPETPPPWPTLPAHLRPYVASSLVTCSA